MIRGAMRVAIVLAGLPVSCAGVFCGQTPLPSVTTLIVSGSPIPAPRSEPSRARLLREIDDPNTGQRWLLYRDPAHPAGPAHLVPDPTTDAALNALRAPELEPSRQTASPVIRAGDRVVVEEDTPAVAARLEATALAAAAAGSPLRVRLAIGGKILRAVALASGRVAMAPAAEPRP